MLAAVPRDINHFDVLDRTVPTIPADLKTRNPLGIFRRGGILVRPVIAFKRTADKMGIGHAFKLDQNGIGSGKGILLDDGLAKIKRHAVGNAD